MAIEVIDEPGALRRRVAQWRGAGERIALVATMGALHAGHVSLVSVAKRRAERVVVSIFVNPAQFAPTEDLAKYPRTFQDDCRLLTEANADLVWAPSVATMYPPGEATRVVPTGVAEGLEAEARPHFFAGVATVCCKLFNQVTPDLAVFGEKDYQQLAVVEAMVRDLAMPLQIVAAPTMREPDGLAMSSRNRYLSVDERRRAVELHATLIWLAGVVRERSDPGEACREAVARLSAAGFDAVDYVEVRNARTLAAVERPAEEGELRVLAAARIGTTRLIDNVAVPPIG